MIGILRKDLSILTTTYRKNLMLVFLLYAAVSIAMRNPFLSHVAIFMMGFYTLSLISIDDASGWDRYVRTLPVSVRAIVTARFLATLVMIGLGVLLSLAMDLFLFWQQHDPLDGLLMGTAISAGLSLLTTGILLPAAYRWGVEKARNTFLVLFLLVFAVPTLLKESLWPVLQQLIDVLDRCSPLFLALAPLAAGSIVFLLGGMVSVGIYSKKEF